MRVDPPIIPIPLEYQRSPESTAFFKHILDRLFELRERGGGNNDDVEFFSQTLEGMQAQMLEMQERINELTSQLAATTDAQLVGFGERLDALEGNLDIVAFEVGVSTGASGSTGTMASQNANNVAITGGTIDGVSLGSSNALPYAQIDNIRINSNTIDVTNTNGDLNLDGNGSGAVKSSSNIYFTGNKFGFGTNSVTSTGASATDVNFHSDAAVSTYVKISNSNTGNGANDGMDWAIDSSGNGYFINRENATVYIGTNNTTCVSMTNSLFSMTNVNLQVKGYTVATLPSASPSQRVIYVSDEAGGATLAFSDGGNWRRVQDRAVVS